MGPLIFVLDNYDSFTYNLVQYLLELGARVEVHRNDRVTVAEALDGGHDGIVISPGPGRPEDAGITMELIRAGAGRIPLLGVCLGHQAMAAVHGGRIVRATRLVHGKTSPIHHDGQAIYAGMDNPFEATRYHSLVVEPESLPEELIVTATTHDGDTEVIMGMRHCRSNTPGFRLLEGVQFHPESILTRDGRRLLANFLENL